MLPVKGRAHPEAWMEPSLDLKREIPVLDWSSHLAARAQGLQRSVLRELIERTDHPDVISFAGGLPASEFFPYRELGEACRYVLREQGATALQYSVTAGYRPLREYLASTMYKYGVPAAPENVLVTNGSQQALDLIGKLFVDPGDTVICSGPTYPGAVQAWNTYGARYSTVDIDSAGMVVEQVERSYRRATSDTGRVPKFIYILPNFHNPTGTTLSLTRREQLAEIARNLDLLVIEDDPYGELRFEGADLAPICSLVPERTVYVSTFSKSLTPGLRLGWIVCPELLIDRFVQAKQGSDLHTGTFVQFIANDICQRGLLKPHARHLCRAYKKRRDTMLDALAVFWPEGCDWTRPEGGLFLWASTPQLVDTVELLEEALSENVAYAPGVHFYPNDAGGRNGMRLNFASCPPDAIVEGVRRLGVAIRTMLGS
jgi:2-aminoadipate transaminase